jgi:hypothetical protein
LETYGRGRSPVRRPGHNDERARWLAIPNSDEYGYRKSQ